MRECGGGGGGGGGGTKMFVVSFRGVNSRFWYHLGRNAYVFTVPRGICYNAERGEISVLKYWHVLARTINQV